jgi:regulator of sigma E protease
MDMILDWMRWLGGNTTIYILPFLAVIGVLVFVHEWGHYNVARMCGVKVETFSIGFGKKIWSRRDKAGTEWRIALFPIGGFVKMFGDTDPASSHFTESVKEGEQLRAMTPAEREQAFFGKSVAKRAAIVFAGPAINFIFAIVILTCLFVTVGQPVTPPVAAAVIVGSAAEQAGFRPNDRVVAIDGKPVRRFADIQRTVAVSLDKPITMEIERDGKTLTLKDVAPKLDTVKDRFGFEHVRGLLGIIGPGIGLSPDGIEAVQGRKGDNVALIKGRMGKASTTLRMKAMGDLPEQQIVVHLDPVLNKDFIEKGKDAVRGIQLAPSLENEIVQFGIVGAVKEALDETWFVSVGTLQSLGQMIIGTRSPQELGGLIRIGAVTGDAAQAGIIALLTLGALLSINLGLINLLPIPMLDGGHLLFYAIEAIKGGPVPEKFQDAALRLGFMVLIALMVFANLNDLIQLAK